MTYAVGLAVDELEIGPAAVDRVAVHRAIAIEPVEVLVEDGLAELPSAFGSRVARGWPETGPDR